MSLFYVIINPQDHLAHLIRQIDFGEGLLIQILYDPTWIVPHFSLLLVTHAFLLLKSPSSLVDFSYPDPETSPNSTFHLCPCFSSSLLRQLNFPSSMTHSCSSQPFQLSCTGISAPYYSSLSVCLLKSPTSMFLLSFKAFFQSHISTFISSYTL